MKNGIISSLLILICISGFSQSSNYEYSGRFTPSIKKENLYDARLIEEIMPEFFRHFSLPLKESVLLEKKSKLQDQLLKVTHYGECKTLFSPEYYYKLMEFVSVNITATCHGNSRTSQSTSDFLTMEQKNILNTADLGTDLHIKINFKFKYPETAFPESGSKITEGEYVVTIVPDTEAEFPGGNKQLSAYLADNIINKFSGKGEFDKIRNAIVKFTVKEDGKIVDAKIFRTSADSKTKQIILDSIYKMPKWKPAKSPMGINVKQEISIPLAEGGC